jgi:trimethylamine:corrinoid methyltransferase-like protein
LSHLAPHAQVSFGMKILAFDLYSNVIGTGSPESLLQGQLEIRLLARYGITPGHFFWSMAGGCDAQAAAERMAGVLMAALAGVRHFGVAGRLQGEAFSLEQLLMDVEIAAHVERVMRGQAWDEDDTAWLAEVDDAVATGTYMGAASTLIHFRKEMSRRPLFDRRTLAQRAELGQPGLQARVRQRLQELDVPGEPPLSAAARGDLDRIYQHAAAQLDR